MVGLYIHCIYVFFVVPSFFNRFFFVCILTVLHRSQPSSRYIPHIYYIMYNQYHGNLSQRRICTGGGEGWPWETVRIVDKSISKTSMHRSTDTLPHCTFTTLVQYRMIIIRIRQVERYTSCVGNAIIIIWLHRIAIVYKKKNTIKSVRCYYFPACQKSADSNWFKDEIILFLSSGTKLW